MTIRAVSIIENIPTINWFRYSGVLAKVLLAGKYFPIVEEKRFEGLKFMYIVFV